MRTFSANLANPAWTSLAAGLVPAQILLLHLTPDTQRPRAVALYQTAVFSSAVIGPLLGGYLTDLFNFKLVLVIGGLGRFLATLIFIWFTVRPNSVSSRQ